MRKMLILILGKIKQTETMKNYLVSPIVVLLLLHTFLSNCLPPMYEGIQHYSEHYNLPPLPFKFGSMEPQFDAPTMKIHYIEVHSNFTKNMNRLLKEWRKEVHTFLGGNFMRKYVPKVQNTRNCNKSFDLLSEKG